MRVVVFLIIYFTLCAAMGIVFVSKAGAAILPMFLSAVVVGAIGGAYTFKHHMGDEDD